MLPDLTATQAKVTVCQVEEGISTSTLLLLTLFGERVD